MAASVQSDRAEGPDAVADRLVADSGQETSEFRRAEEAGNGFGQIGVGRLMTGDELANLRQDFAEIPTINIPQQPLTWLGKFEDRDGSARLKDSMNFAQARFVVGEIAEAEGASYQIKR